MNAAISQIERALAYIEAHLFEALPLTAIARQAAYSPWHFHRLFAALTGETPAAYQRKRRFGEICRRLVESDVPIVALALDCGFESQASFTRAFTRHIGVSPARFRKAGHLEAGHCYPPIDLAALVARQERSCLMEPKLVRKPSFHVIGMAGAFTPNTNTAIPALWSRFVPHIDAIPHRRGHHTFGVCIPAEEPASGEAGFTYVAGVEVDRIDAVPDGMIALTIPDSRYAVFTHRGHVARIKDTFNLVFGSWLPATPHRHLPAPDFEFYDERFDPATGEGEVDIYVPIADDAQG